MGFLSFFLLFRSVEAFFVSPLPKEKLRAPLFNVKIVNVVSFPPLKEA